MQAKLLPVMGMALPALPAVRDLLEAEPVRADEVESITVASSERIFMGDVGFPGSPLAIRASLAFLVAAAIARRDEFLADPYLLRFIRADLVTDQAVLELFDRVTLRADPAITATMESGPRQTLDARVTIRLRDGRTLTAYRDIFPETSALTFADLAAKFRAVSQAVLEPARAEAILAMVADLDSLPEVGELVRLLSTQGR
jgi:2-methylcitrate dehydratase PrpD